jgi:hypothetical protein
MLVKISPASGPGNPDTELWQQMVLIDKPSIVTNMKFLLPVCFFTQFLAC